MRVVILAGGEGKRLRPLTDSVPKPLVKINSRAIIDRQIDSFVRCGVKEFVVLCGYKNDELRKHFSCYEKAEVRVVVESEPLGTAGAIKAARGAIGSDAFVVINGDIMTDLDLSPMLSGGGEFLAKIALVPMTSPFGVVKTFGDKIIGFEEKPVIRDIYINAGIYWLSNGVFDLLPARGSIETGGIPQAGQGGNARLFQVPDTQ